MRRFPWSGVPTCFVLCVATGCASWATTERTSSDSPTRFVANWTATPRRDADKSNGPAAHSTQSGKSATGAATASNERTLTPTSLRQATATRPADANDHNASARVKTDATSVPAMVNSATVVSSATASKTTNAAFENRVNSATPVDTCPIDLPTALALTDQKNPLVALARERITEAYAQIDRADALWLPSLRAGVNYNKHEGRIQDVAGKIIETSRGSVYTGLGANAVGAGSPAIPGLYASFHIADAIHQPRIAERIAAARESGAQAETNDAVWQTALAYLELLRAYQDLAIAQEIRDKAQALEKLTGAYADSGQGLAADHDRARTELAIRENDVRRAEEAVQVACARLAQQLNFEATTVFLPQDPAVVPLDLCAVDLTAQDAVVQALSHRPEVAESRQLVAEAVERLERERRAPLIPSVLLGVSYGGNGGGLGSRIDSFSDRFDGDAVAYWEVRNLGFGEKAIREEAKSRVAQAHYREIAQMDRVAREAVEAHAQVISRRQQISSAEQAVSAALQSYERNWERIQQVQGLPLESLQSLQALAQARREYLRTVTDFNAAQFNLRRALGQ